MHVHLPKPLHGWRAFTGEVGIIVIGVLIALGAEQVVESWQWHEKVAVVRKSLVGELANDRARWEVNMARAPCYLDSIDKLDRWARDGGTGDTTTAVSRLSGFFWMHSANWNLATGSQTLDHFPINEQLAFAALYDGLAHREVDIEKASDLFDRVTTLAPLADDAQSRRELRSALGNLRFKIADLTGNDKYMERHFDAVGVKADQSDFAAEARSVRAKCVK